jgi:hypothetical protein
VREGATLSDDVVPTGQRPSGSATGRPRVLVIGGRLEHVRKARELGLDVVHAQFPAHRGTRASTTAGVLRTTP